MHSNHILQLVITSKSRNAKLVAHNASLGPATVKIAHSVDHRAMEECEDRGSEGSLLKVKITGLQDDFCFWVSAMSSGAKLT